MGSSDHILYHYGIEQRSPEWFALKAGKFSGSEITPLIAPKGIGVAGETYITKKRGEYFSKSIDQTDSKSMRYGREMEPIAIQQYEAASKLELEFPAFVENHNYPNVGVSPDAIYAVYDEIHVGKNTKLLINSNKSIGFEFKCPETRIEHQKHLELTDQNDLKKMKSGSIVGRYYWQIMLCLLITEFQEWRFISYHYDFNHGKEYDLSMLEIPVYRDQLALDFLAERLGEANNIFDKKVQQIKKRYRIKS